MTVLRRSPRERRPRSVRAGIALAIAAAIGVAAAWSPKVGIAAGVAVGVATLLFEVLIWTDGEDDDSSPPAAPGVAGPSAP